MKRIALLVAGVMIGLTVCSLVYASGETVFGPEAFTVNWWHGHLSYHSFRASGSGPGTIRITKTHFEDVPREGYLVLNYRVIPLGHFLESDGGTFEKAIELRPGNSLVVFLLGQPGASIHLEIREQAAPAPVPEVHILANPDTIALGESTTLSWTTTAAETATVDPGIGTVPLNGSVEVFPQETTSYSITASGPGGTATGSVTVTVHIPQTMVRLDINPKVVEPGNSVELTWHASNAESCILEPSIGPVDMDGTLRVTPETTTTYRILADGPGGSTSASASVSVILPPDDINHGVNQDEQQGGGGLVGGTLRILNGNVLVSRSDLLFPSPHSLGLSLKAWYNSRSERQGLLGYGWSGSYDVSLDPGVEIQGVPFVRIIDETGKAHYFLKQAAGGYTGFFGECSMLDAGGEGLAWRRLDGIRYVFSEEGKLQYVEDGSGNRLGLEYNSEGLLVSVMDLTDGRDLDFQYDALGNVIAVLGPVTTAVPDGVWVRYEYDGDRRLLSVSYADGSGFRYKYDDAGDIHNLIEIRDLADHLLKTWAYDGTDRATDSAGTDGKGVHLLYVSEDQVDVTDAYGAVRSYFLERIHGQEKVGRMTGPAVAPYAGAGVVRWGYDDHLRLVQVEYAGGVVNQYLDYDDRGNPGTIRLAAGTPEERVLSLAYHPWTNRLASRSERSVLGDGEKTTIWDFDADDNDIPNENPTNRVYRVIERGYTLDESAVIVPYEYVTKFTYNAKGQVTSIDGPEPGSEDGIHLTYNESTCDLTGVERPLVGATVFSEYDAAGNLLNVTDVNTQTDTFTYDGRGRLTATTHAADGSGVRITYDLAGKPETVKDPDGLVKSFSYDDVTGRLIRVSDASDNFIACAYDDQGNVTEVSLHDPLGVETFWKGFDYRHPSLPGKLYRELLPDDTYRQYEYDPRGNLVSVKEPSGQVTEYTYDSMNRVIRVVRPLDAITSFGYDSQDHLVSVTDGEGHETTFQYDDMGRMVWKDSPDTGVLRCVYDEVGHLISRTDANGITVSYSYDLLDRIRGASFPEQAENILYDYDEGANGKGRLTGITDPSGTTGFQYDSRGRLVTKITTVNDISYTISRAFTPGGRLSRMTYPTGTQVDYRRNPLGRVEGVDVSRNGTSVRLLNDISYLPFGPAIAMNLGTGSRARNVFDAQYRLVFTNPGTEMERRFAYDYKGNLISVLSPGNPWMDETFTYDELDRLVRAAGSYGLIEYAYDRAGNRLSRNVNGEMEDFRYGDGNNRIEEAAGSDPLAFSYDFVGNMVGMGTKTLTYDQENRLAGVAQNGGSIARYAYNALGQRVLKETGGESTVSHYDFEGNLIAEGLPEGTITSEYFYLGKSRLARVDREDGKLYYYVNDHLGTPHAMTDSEGMVVWEARYMPFGKVEVNPKSIVVNRFRFPGQISDEATGLNYNYFRDYHPGLGRYVEPDPIGLEGGSNLYAYCSNNPVNLTDPTGQFVITGIVLVRIGIGVASGAFSGWVAGMRSGNVWGGIAGGVVGGLSGGLIGIMFPQASGVLGNMIGGAIAGGLGGGFGAGVGKRLSNAAATNAEMALAIAKGFSIGVVTGGITAGIGAGVVSVGSAGVVGKLAGTIAASPVGMALSLIDLESETSIDAGELPVVQPEKMDYPADWFPELRWGEGNPEEIDPGTSVQLYVEEGIPPFSWSVTGSGFTLSQYGTQEPSNTLTAGSEVCGSVVVDVTDGSGARVSGSLRVPNRGRWVLMVDESCADIDLEPGQCNCTNCSLVVRGGYRYQDCWWGGTRPARYHGPYCEKWPYTEDLSDACCYCPGYYPCFSVVGVSTHTMWKWECN